MNKTNFKLTPFGWKRNFEYIKINFYILYKRILEYKANFWSSFITEIFYFATTLIFFNIILNELNFIEWELIDFFLLIVISSLIYGVFGLFTWKGLFSEYIINGQLNLYILKPMKTWILFYFSRLAPPGMVFIIIDIITIILIKNYSNLTLFNLFLSLIIFQLIILSLITMSSFISSFDFHILKISEQIEPIIWTSINFFNLYPAIYFKNFPFKTILILMPGFFIGSLLLPLIRNYEIWKMEFQIIILICSIIIFTLGTAINWHYGLKKYEAFG